MNRDDDEDAEEIDEPEVKTTSKKKPKPPMSRINRNFLGLVCKEENDNEDDN
jgi:hypothetical protein